MIGVFKRGYTTRRATRVLRRRGRRTLIVLFDSPCCDAVVGITVADLDRALKDTGRDTHRVKCGRSLDHSRLVNTQGCQWPWQVTVHRDRYGDPMAISWTAL